MAQQKNSDQDAERKNDSLPERPTRKNTQYTHGIDRLMDYQDRVLYAMRSLYGTRASGRLAVRAMAVQWNFHPYSARAQSEGAKRSSFEARNGFQYHGNWLHNLLSAASMGGRRL